jgi:hypothetical protein
VIIIIQDIYKNYIESPKSVNLLVNKKFSNSYNDARDEEYNKVTDYIKFLKQNLN